MANNKAYNKTIKKLRKITNSITNQNCGKVEKRSVIMLSVFWGLFGLTEGKFGVC